tara:strand:+ start:1329 stop:1505 length:177 start_codon:yes stop_codon:yes gene_type:complete
MWWEMGIDYRLASGEANANGIKSRVSRKQASLNSEGWNLKVKSAALPNCFQNEKLKLY